MVYECKRWFVARYTGFEKSARHGFFSNVGTMDSQEDNVSAVSPGLLVNVYERKRCLNWICSVLIVYRQVLRKARIVLLAGVSSRASVAWIFRKIVRAMFCQVS